MSTSSQQNPPKLRSRLLRIAARLVRGGLCLLLALQAVLLAIILTNGELPVPQIALDYLRKPFARAGYSVDWEHLHVNLNGQVMVTGLRIGSGSGEHNEILSARTAVADFSMLGLLTGNFIPWRLVVDEAALLCPAQLSPTGDQAPLLTNISFDLQQKNGLWEVNALRAEVFNVRVQAEGEIPLQWLQSIIDTFSSDEQDAPSRPFLQRYGDIAHTLLVQENDLRKLQQPTINLRFSPWPQPAEQASSWWPGFLSRAAPATDENPDAVANNLLLRVNLGAQSYRNPAIGMESGRSHLNALLLFDDKGIPSAITTPYSWTENLRWYNKAFAARVLVQLPKPSGGRRSLQNVLEAPLDTLRLSGWGINAYGFPLDHGQINIVASGGKDLIDAHDYLIKASIANQWDHLSGFAQLNRKTGRGWVDFVADWNPDYLGSIPKDKLPAALRDGLPLHFGTTPHVAGHIVFDNDFKPSWAGLSIHTGSVSYEQLSLAYSYVDAHWDGRHISVDSALAYSKDGYSAVGSYWQDLQTDEYRVWADGTIDPAALSPLIDQEWWTQLWAEFQFEPPYWPWASFAMVGTHNMGTVGKRIYVEARMEKFGYRGIATDGSHALLYMNGDRVDLYDFTIHTEKGSASGHLQWQWQGQVRHYLAFEATSTLPIADGTMMVGKETAEVMEPFKSALPPRISVIGVLVGDAAAGTKEDVYLKLYADFPSTFSYEWLNMDNLRSHIIITPTTRELPDIEGTLAGGNVIGSVHLDVLEDSQIAFRTELDVQGAELDRLADALTFLQGNLVGEIDISTPPNAPANPSLAAVTTGGSGHSPAAEAAVAQAQAPVAAPAVQHVNLASNSTENAPGMNVLDLPGLVYFKGQISGMAQSMSTFQGGGDLLIYAQDLAQINLFGGLSSLFRFLSIPVGTLVFNKADASWTLTDGIVHMPAVRITGNVGLITASGNIDLETSNINFLLYLQPMGEITFPVISQALSLFTPLSNALSVRITGSLGTPSFKTNVHPVGIFSGKSSIAPQDMKVPEVRPPLQQKDNNTLHRLRRLQQR